LTAVWRADTPARALEKIPSMWNLAPRLAGEIGLAGEIVVLEPLVEEHFDALFEAGRPPEIWRWWTVEMAGEAPFRNWFDEALRARIEAR
jgi:hypothetical protein